MGVYTVRNLDEKTKEVIAEYAESHDLNMGQAISQLVRLAVENLQHKKKEKRFKNLAELYEHLKFKSDKNLSRDHDKVAYGL